MADGPWTLEYIEANGLIFETAVTAPTGPGNRRLALCLHGFPETYYSWRYQMPLLARLGYTVWAPNMRGYGYSSRPERIADYTLDHLMADVEGLYDAAVARGHTPTLLMAHDWGGLVAWASILNRVRPFERFIVVNMPHPELFRRKFFQDGQFLRSWYVYAFQLPWLPEKLLCANKARAVGKTFLDMAQDKTQFPDEVLDVYRQNALIPGCATAMINYYRANFRPFGGLGVLADPPITDIPTLMIWGEKDSALGKPLTEGTEEYVPKLTLHYLPNVSHWAQQEAPEPVNRHIEAWLERVGPGGG